MAKIRTKIFLVVLMALFAVSQITANAMPDTRALSKENRLTGNYLKLPGGDNLVIISDEAVTSSNDSLESIWLDVSNCSDVELAIFIDDSTRIDYYIDYSFGTFKSETGTGYLTLAVDSITTAGTTSTGKYKGVILRGCGTSSEVNQIPGANWIRWRGYRNSSRSETTNTCKVALKTIKP